MVSHYYHHNHYPLSLPTITTDGHVQVASTLSSSGKQQFLDHILEQELSFDIAIIGPPLLPPPPPH